MNNPFDSDEAKQKDSSKKIIPERKILTPKVLVRVPDTLSLLDSAKGLINYDLECLQSKAVKREEFNTNERAQLRRLIQSIVEIAAEEREQQKQSNLDKLGDKELFRLVMEALPVLAKQQKDGDFIKLVEEAVKILEEKKDESTGE